MNIPRYDADQQTESGGIARWLARYWTICLYGFIALLVLALMAVATRAEISFGTFTVDPMTVAKGEPYFGLLSNVGILFWCAATTLCFFTASLPETATQTSGRFFIMSGLFTLGLLLDDLFLLHEYVFPRFLGIRQRYVLLGYLFLVCLYLANYWKVLLSRHPIVMTVALALFGLSLTEDIFTLAPAYWHYPLEDGTKLFGIISWFTYFALVCHEEVQRCSVNRTETSPSQAKHPFLPGHTSTKRRLPPSPLSSVPDG